MTSGSFDSTSSEKPCILTVSFASDPAASLGTQLTCHDKGEISEMFTPAYASISKLLDGETIAKKCGVKVGDCIIAVNGEGFRRFPPDYDERDLHDLTPSMNSLSLNDDNDEKVDDETKKKLKYRVISGMKQGEAYSSLLSKIKQVKSAMDPQDPLVLTLERYGWDARVNSWPRFLTARNNDVTLAMQMIQDHETWRESRFPMDLSQSGIQTIINSKAVSEIDIQHDELPPTVYVDFSKLQSLEETCQPEDVVNAFLYFTETLLARSADPRNPKASQFIDLSSSNISGGLRVGLLKKIYAAFEPNYPETLHKMVMYPVSKVVRKTSSMLLSFVNENTRKKFVITDDLDVVCQELGWNKEDIEKSGGVTAFMHQHEKSSSD